MKKRLVSIALLVIAVFAVVYAQEAVYDEDVTSAFVLSVSAGTFEESSETFLLTLLNVPSVTTQVFKTPEFIALAYNTKTFVDDWNFILSTPVAEVITVPATLTLEDRVIELLVTNPTYNEEIQSLSFTVEVVEAYWLLTDEKDDATAPEQFGGASFVINFDNASINALYDGQAMRLDSSRDVTAQSTCPPVSYCRSTVGKRDAKCNGCPS